MMILTGPTAAGKNTISHIIARSCSQCAVVDFDAIRNMFVNPHLTPWDGEEGKAQQYLGIQHVCKVALGFKKAGWKVIILDVLNNNTLQEYYRSLPGQAIRVVQLLPTFEELNQRFLTRGRCLTDQQFRWVYEEQCNLTSYDLRIDNTDLAPLEAAKIIENYL
ncbi:MAG: hypothetical protein K0R76_307 [Alphaproteobacteria bacterium]|jgi:chloramphenicol 3-O-phosphotransferase|nr:hypothetical protein [Alphaproteobacteria bacterium]